jgi:RTX calcium-binding nonapeptide repeat (4 copies)
MALALLLAAGVALAAPITCQVGVTCNGTSSDDTITGTTSNDTINGLGGNDTISALDGIDKINGGPNNDTMDGGAGNDTYQFANFWGIDRISADSGGVDTLSFAPHTQAYTTSGAGVSAGLSGDGPTICEDFNRFDPCYTIEGSFIENLIGTRFTDELFGNESNNKITSGDGGSWDPFFGQISTYEFLNGLAGADSYQGYTPGGQANGVDVIRDSGGSTNVDKLVLTQYNLNDVSFAQHNGTVGSANMDTLLIFLPNNELIFVWTYFQGTSTNACANASGKGLIERISFADDSNVDFAQVKQRLGCPAAGSGQATGTMQAGLQPQSFTKPESSHGTNGVATNSQR